MQLLPPSPLPIGIVKFGTVLEWRGEARLRPHPRVSTRNLYSSWPSRRLAAMAAEPSKTLLQLLGAYDNLSEPEPVANRPETIIGLALSFLVRLPPRPLSLPALARSRSCVLARLSALCRILF